MTDYIKTRCITDAEVTDSKKECLEKVIVTITACLKQKLRTQSVNSSSNTPEVLKYTAFDRLLQEPINWLQWVTYTWLTKLKISIYTWLNTRKPTRKMSILKYCHINKIFYRNTTLCIYVKTYYKSCQLHSNPINKKQFSCKIDLVNDFM